MQRFVLVSSVLLAVLKFGNGQDEFGSNLYSRRYEQLDVDTVLKSPRLVSNYVECLLNKKPCPPEGKALKRILPEALRTKCAKCWPSQKEGALKVITSLYFKYPHYYKALREKWDPTGEYHRRFEEYLKDQKFNSIGNGSDSEAGEQAQGSSININVTQRPTRQGQNQNQGGQAQTPPPNVAQDELTISNRFGGDDDDNGGYEYETPVTTMKTMPTRPSTQKTMRPVASTTVKCGTVATTDRPTRQPLQPPKPMGTSQTAGSNYGNNWNHQGTTTTTFYIKTQNPVLNIINRITMKFANTAEFIAGMLRGGVSQADDHNGYYQPVFLHRVSVNKPPNNRRIIFQKTISF